MDRDEFNKAKDSEFNCESECCPSEYEDLEDEVFLLKEEHEEVLENIMEAIHDIREELDCEGCIEEATKAVLREFFVLGYREGVRDSKLSLIDQLDNELDYMDSVDECDCGNCNGCDSCEK